MVWKFVIPDPESFPSGGNNYNEQIIEALSELQEVIEIKGLNNIGSQSTTAAIHIWDTLFINEYDKVNFKNISGRHILLVHHLESMFPGPKSIFEEIEKPVIERMDGCWVTSAYSQNYLADKGVQKPIWVLPPIFNRSNKKVLEKEKNHIPEILIAANLIERKGILPFLQKLSLIQNLPNFSLSIIGSQELDASYAQQCKQIVNQDAVLNQRITFLGVLHQYELFSMYQKADLYISTSYFETFGMSIQESLCYGTPVLGLIGGNIPNLIEDKGWCLSSMEQLVECFIELMIDPSKLRSKKVDYTNWKPNWKEAAKYLINKVKI